MGEVAHTARLYKHAVDFTRLSILHISLFLVGSCHGRCQRQGRRAMSPLCTWEGPEVAICPDGMLLLAQAARTCRQLPTQLRKRLMELDVAAALVRHVTQPSVDQLLCDLSAAMREQAAAEKSAAAKPVGVQTDQR